MSEIDSVAKEQLAREGAPHVAVYAAAVGLASAVPVPFLDRALAGLARGAGLRRVAARHGVRLAGEAREILSTASPGSDRSAAVGAMRRVLVQLVAPLRIAARLEDGVATFAAAVLLEHYLAGRATGGPITVDEARLIRDAMQDGAVRGAFESLRAAPGGAVRTVISAVRAAAKPDTEDRTPAERFVDALLDSAADAPAEVIDRMKQAFDEALRSTD